MKTASHMHKMMGFELVNDGAQSSSRTPSSGRTSRRAWPRCLAMGVPDPVSPPVHLYITHLCMDMEEASHVLTRDLLGHSLSSTLHHFGPLHSMHSLGRFPCVFVLQTRVGPWYKPSTDKSKLCYLCCFAEGLKPPRVG